MHQQHSSNSRKTVMLGCLLLMLVSTGACTCTHTHTHTHTDTHRHLLTQTITQNTHTNPPLHMYLCIYTGKYKHLGYKQNWFVILMLANSVMLNRNIFITFVILLQSQAFTWIILQWKLVSSKKVSLDFSGNPSSFVH